MTRSQCNFFVCLFCQKQRKRKHPFSAVVEKVKHGKSLTQSVRLHVQLSRATVKAQLDHLTELLSLSHCTCAEGELICHTLLL